MKKVCLITYTGSPNYGAALQLFATYQVLRDMDCDVMVVNYRNQFESRKKGLKFLLSKVGIREKAREYISSYVFGVKKNARHNFEDFYSQLKYTPRIDSIDEIGTIGDFDVYCVGSDQVWNPEITGGYDDVFILNTALGQRKISYASSMGSCILSHYSDETFIRSLRRFDCISVREKIALDYLQERLDVPVRQVIDPTFLLGQAGWDRCIGTVGKDAPAREQYVLIYALGGDFEKNRDVAQCVAKKTGTKVYALTLSNRNKGVDRIISDATPFDFVRYIKNARFVVTNSFHGTCFSLMMGVPFYSVRYGVNPVRAEELLAFCGLENRLFRQGDALRDELLGNDDILEAQGRIACYAEESREWLRSAVYGE